MNFCLRGWAPILCLAALVPVARIIAQSPAQNSVPNAVTNPAQTSSAGAAEAGLETPWEVRKTIADVLKQTDQLRPLLQSLDPQQWSSQNGAPDAYIVQRSVAERQLNDLAVATKLFSQKPETLSLGLDLYFRLEALDVTARSLDEGAREYADRGTADKLAQLIAASFTSRQQLQGDLTDLAKSGEENFKIADEEAQRCRGTISREPPAVPSKRTKKK